MALPRARLSAFAALAVTGTVVLGSVAGVSPAIAATFASGDGAAGWLAGQLVDGKMPSTWAPGTTDWGLTADTVLALTSRKVAQNAATAATDSLESNVRTYISPAGGATRSAGAVAKIALVAQVQGRDATHFGGEDLLATLNDLKSTTAPNAGRFSDELTGSDYSGALSQSLALLALSRNGAVPADAVQFMVGLQCSNGGFSYTPDPTTSTCVSNSEADADVTSFAIQSLVADGVAGQPGVATALAKAADYLESVQKPDGSFVESWSQASNASSTGLSAQALLLAGRSASAATASAWVSALQVNCENAGSGPAVVSRGALAYDPDALSTAIASGIDNGSADQFRRTTSQAILGLSGSDSLANMSATGASSAAPGMTCQVPPTEGPRTGPTSPTVSSVNYASAMTSARITAVGPAGTTLLHRVRTGSKGASGWIPSGGNIPVKASKTARYVEVIARNNDGDSQVTTVLVQSQLSSASRRGCQAIGGVTITHPASARATVNFAPRKKSCASWRVTTNGRWKAIKRGAATVSFKLPNSVGVNWQARTGNRVLSISVRTPR